MTVRTDNLFIAHYQGSLLEEFHYYPFGMCFDVSKSPMLGKSAKPLKCMLKDYKDMEDCGDCLGDCEATFRNYDAQIGRWLQPDPLMQHPSPYLAMSNNPVSFTDPTGLWDDVRKVYTTGDLWIDGQRVFWFDGESNSWVAEEAVIEGEAKSYPVFRYSNTSGDPFRGYETLRTPYGEKTARYNHNHYAWGMNLKEGAQGGGGLDVNSSSFKFVNTSTAILNSQSQIAETASTMAKNDVARGLKAPYSSMKSQINTLNKIGNVAKYGGAATSLLSVGLSYLKYQSTGKITASDGIGLLSASVAVTAVFFGGPVIVGSGLILGAIQLVGGEYTDTITIYNRGNPIPPNRN